MRWDVVVDPNVEVEVMFLFGDIYIPSFMFQIILPIAAVKYTFAGFFYLSPTQGRNLDRQFKL